MNNIHKLVRGTRDEYMGVSFPDPYTLYFTTDSHELFLGSSKIGSGFLYIDAEHPKPEEGIPGYIYIDRLSFDMWIWNENLQKWMYIGCAGDNNVSVHIFTEFKDNIEAKLQDVAHIISVINAEDLPEDGREDTFYFVEKTGTLYLWEDGQYFKILGSGEGGDSDHSDTADKLTSPVNISLSGDATGTVQFDGSKDVSIAVTLSDTGTAAGTFNNKGDKQTPFTVDTKGRITNIGEEVDIAPQYKNIQNKPTTVDGLEIPELSDGSFLDGVRIVCGESDGDSSGIDIPGSETPSGNAETAKTAEALKTPRSFSVSGDVTADPVMFDGTANVDLKAKLPNVGTAGTYGSSTETARITTDDKGRVVEAESVKVTPSFNDITDKPNNLEGYGITDAVTKDEFEDQIEEIKNSIESGTGSADESEVAVSLKTPRNFSISGDVTAPAVQFDGTDDVSLQASLPNVGTAGTYGSSTETARITTDDKGRITNAANVKVTPSFDDITNKPDNLEGYGITDAVTKDEFDAYKDTNGVNTNNILPGKDFSNWIKITTSREISLDASQYNLNFIFTDPDSKIENFAKDDSYSITINKPGFDYSLKNIGQDSISSSQIKFYALTSLNTKIERINHFSIGTNVENMITIGQNNTLNILCINLAGSDNNSLNIHLEASTNERDVGYNTNDDIFKNPNSELNTMMKDFINTSGEKTLYLHIEGKTTPTLVIPDTGDHGGEDEDVDLPVEIPEQSDVLKVMWKYTIEKTSSGLEDRKEATSIEQLKPDNSYTSYVFTIPDNGHYNPPYIKKDVETIDANISYVDYYQVDVPSMYYPYEYAFRITGLAYMNIGLSENELYSIPNKNSGFQGSYLVTDDITKKKYYMLGSMSGINNVRLTNDDFEQHPNLVSILDSFFDEDNPNTTLYVEIGYKYSIVQE